MLDSGNLLFLYNFTVSPHLSICVCPQTIIYFVLAVLLCFNYLFIHSPLIFPLSSPCWYQMNSFFCRNSAGNGLMQLEHNYCSVRMLGWPLYLKNKRIEKYPAAKSQEEKKNLDASCSFPPWEVFVTSPRYQREREREKIIRKIKNLKWRWNDLAEMLSLRYVLIHIKLATHKEPGIILRCMTDRNRKALLSLPCSLKLYYFQQWEPPPEFIFQW